MRKQRKKKRNIDYIKQIWHTKRGGRHEPTCISNYIKHKLTKDCS